jgi:ABC-2 type transport system permease protein
MIIGSEIHGAVMKKYLTLFRVNWQKSLQYRFAVVVYILGYSIYISVLLYLWTAIYQDGGKIGDYELPELLTYYLLQLVVNTVIFSYVSWEIIDHIKDGMFSNFLTKPIHAFRYWLTVDLSGKILEVIFISLAIGLMAIFVARHFFFPPDAAAWFHFLLAAFLAILLAFELDFCIGMIAFWLIQVRVFKYMLQSIIFFFAGALLPLDIFPEYLFRIAEALPFQYLVFFPVSIYLGKVADPWPSFLAMIGWIAVLYVLAHVLLNRGVRRYVAVGG